LQNATLQHEGDLSHSTAKNETRLGATCGFRCLLDFHRIGYRLVDAGMVLANAKSHRSALKEFFNRIQFRWARAGREEY
jgi:hypothetical protein